MRGIPAAEGGSTGTGGIQNEASGGSSPANGGRPATGGEPGTGVGGVANAGGSTATAGAGAVPNAGGSIATAGAGGVSNAGGRTATAGAGGITSPDLCGNGVREPKEGCDDGNGVGGDGCSPDCVREADFYCVAGNGKRDRCAPCRTYVNAASTASSPDGASWISASSDLQIGIDQARRYVGTECTTVEVWVAAGTYRPGAPTNRDASFQLRMRVALFGGFSGSETNREQRDVDRNPTILSGDLAGDGNVLYADNARHVVTAFDYDSTLDGFVVSDGHGDCDDTRQDDGGGLYNKGDLRLVHVTFGDNFACRGGGLFSDGVASLSDVRFSGNGAGTSARGGEGGGLYASGEIRLEDVTFTGNRGYRAGGGAYVHEVRSTFRDLSFEDNMSWPGADSTDALWSGIGIGGGMAIVDDDTITLQRVLFVHNSGAAGSALFTAAKNVVIDDARFEGNTSTGGESCGGALFAYAVDETTVSNALFSGNFATNGGAICSQLGSVILRQSTLSDNVAGDAGAGFFGPTLIATDTLFRTNDAPIGSAIVIRRRVANVEKDTDSVLTNVTMTDQRRGSAIENASGAWRTSVHIVNSVLDDLEPIAGEPVDVSYTCVAGGVRASDDSGNNLDHCGPSPDETPFADLNRSDYRLAPNAAAIDAGNDDAPGLAGVTTDLAGQPRFNGRVDMGAYER